MILLSDLPRVVKQLREWNWAVKGSIDDMLTLEKFPMDSKLKAILMTKNLGDENYLIVGGLYSQEDPFEAIGTDEENGAIIAIYKCQEKRIFGVSYVVAKNRLLRELGDIITNHFELYFGETNIPYYRKICEDNRTT